MVIDIVAHASFCLPNSYFSVLHRSCRRPTTKPCRIYETREKDSIQTSYRGSNRPLVRLVVVLVWRFRTNCFRKTQVVFYVRMWHSVERFMFLSDTFRLPTLTTLTMETSRRSRVILLDSLRREHFTPQRGQEIHWTPLFGLRKTVLPVSSLHSTTNKWRCYRCIGRHDTVLSEWNVLSRQTRCGTRPATTLPPLVATIARLALPNA